MIRTTFVWFSIAISLLVLGSLVIITSPFDRKGKVIHLYGRLWGKVCLLANRVKVRVEGIEHLKGEGPYIFMSNHQGTYDIFALLGYLPFQFKWLAKKELFSVPFFGWVLTAAGYVSVDREGTRKTVEAMNEAARKIREGMSLVIFPEGSRSPDGSIQPFKKGGFTLAIKSKVPIIPISISGSREVMPKEKFASASGEIRIRIDHPIEVQNFSLKDREFLMEKVNQIISKNFKVISSLPPRRRESGDGVSATRPSPACGPKPSVGEPVKEEGDISERKP